MPRRASSVGCRPRETPDGRPGVAILMFGFSQDALAKAVPKRTGQCLMTCPSTAVFDGLATSEKRIALGKHLRFFGDGYQKSKLVDGKRFWRVPVMDGEFLVQEDLGVDKGVGGGNIIIQTVTKEAGLAAARRAVEALAGMDGMITPFPGGVARSGSKVGSRYKGSAGFDLRSLLPHAARPRRVEAASGGQLCLRGRDRRDQRGSGRGRRWRRPCRRPSGRTLSPSAPATMAANWGSSISICGNS